MMRKQYFRYMMRGFQQHICHRAASASVRKGDGGEAREGAKANIGL